MFGSVLGGPVCDTLGKKTGMFVVMPRAFTRTLMHPSRTLTHPHAPPTAL